MLRTNMSAGEEKSDLCVQFSDLSAITSPFLSPTIDKRSGSSLFSRLSRGIHSNEYQAGDHDHLLSPVSTSKLDTHFDSLSSIVAEDSHFVGRNSDSWNGQVSQQRNGRLRYQGGGQTPGSRPDPKHDWHSEDDISTRDDTMRIEDKISEETKNASPASVRRHEQGDERDRNVSWEISPSTGYGYHRKSLHTPEGTLSETRNAAKKENRQRADNVTSLNDKWREVVDPESGRKYFYNR